MPSRSRSPRLVPFAAVYSRPSHRGAARRHSRSETRARASSGRRRVPRRSMTSRRWRGLHGNIDTEVSSGSNTCARVHEPRRRNRRADVDVRLRLRPQMGEAIGAVTERSRGILLGRTTYEMFEPAWSTRTVEDDPGAPFFNDTTKY